MILASHGIIGSQIVQATGLLAEYPGAAAAYSLRQLTTAYTGSAIRVRRANDNTEEDIGFVNNELDTSALTTFCSGTNGFVKTWYDQSGNARDASETTAANQPQIVDSGSVILENGKPCVQFDGVNDTLSIASIPNTLSNSLFVVDNRNRQNTGTTDFAVNMNRDRYYYDKNSFFVMASNSNFEQIADLINTTNQIELLSLFYSSSSSVYRNGIIKKSGVNLIPSNNSGPGLIGSFSSTQFFAQVKHQEIIYYPSDQSSNRTGIETNINDFYSIY